MTDCLPLTSPVASTATARYTTDAYPQRLNDAREIARYMSSFAGNESFDERMAEEYFFGCAATLRRMEISRLHEGNEDQNVRSASKEREYTRMDSETAPPIVVEDEQVMDGNHRCRAGRKRKDSFILVYEVHPMDEFPEPYVGNLDAKDTARLEDAHMRSRIHAATSAQSYLGRIPATKGEPSP